MKSIANIIHHKNFPLDILDSNGKLIYIEYSDGAWLKCVYDLAGHQVYYENSSGYARDDRP